MEIFSKVPARLVHNSLFEATRAHIATEQHGFCLQWSLVTILTEYSNYIQLQCTTILESI